MSYPAELLQTELVKVLESMERAATREHLQAKKRAKKNSRFRSGERYWEGMRQGYENALTIVKYKFERAAKLSKEKAANDAMIAEVLAIGEKGDRL